VVLPLDEYGEVVDEPFFEEGEDDLLEFWDEELEDITNELFGDDNDVLSDDFTIWLLFHNILKDFQKDELNNLKVHTKIWRFSYKNGTCTRVGTVNLKNPTLLKGKSLRFNC